MGCSPIFNSRCIWVLLRELSLHFSESCSLGYVTVSGMWLSVLTREDRKRAAPSVFQRLGAVRALKLSVLPKILATFNLPKVCVLWELGRWLIWASAWHSIMKTWVCTLSAHRKKPGVLVCVWHSSAGESLGVRGTGGLPGNFLTGSSNQIQEFQVQRRGELLRKHSILISGLHTNAPLC